MGEPKALSRGKVFHKRVQEDWKRDAEGDIRPEHTITLLGKTTKSGRQRRGRACRARVAATTRRGLGWRVGKEIPYRAGV